MNMIEQEKKRLQAITVDKWNATEQEDLNLQFIYICELNYFELVQFLLTDPQLIRKPDISYHDFLCVKKAAKYGHFDIIHFFLTHPNTKDQIDIHLDNDYLLRHAALNGHMDIVKFLLTSSELKEHSNIHGNDHDLIQSICNSYYYEKLELFHYLLTSPDLKEHADIHCHDDAIFKHLCQTDSGLKKMGETNEIPLLEYLIFKLHIEQTPEIKLFLENNHYPTIQQMFDNRNLNQDLNQDLKINSDKKKRKI